MSNKTPSYARLRQYFHVTCHSFMRIILVMLSVCFVSCLSSTKESFAVKSDTNILAETVASADGAAGGEEEPDHRKEFIDKYAKKLSIDK